MTFNVGEKVIIKKKACSWPDGCHLFCNPLGCKGVRGVVKDDTIRGDGRWAIIMKSEMDWCSFPEECLSKLCVSEEEE